MDSEYIPSNQTIRSLQLQLVLPISKIRSFDLKNPLFLIAIRMYRVNRENDIESLGANSITGGTKLQSKGTNWPFKAM